MMSVPFKIGRLPIHIREQIWSELGTLALDEATNEPNLKKASNMANQILSRDLLREYLLKRSKRWEARQRYRQTHRSRQTKKRPTTVQQTTDTIDSPKPLGDADEWDQEIFDNDNHDDPNAAVIPPTTTAAPTIPTATPILHPVPPLPLTVTRTVPPRPSAPPPPATTTAITKKRQRQHSRTTTTTAHTYHKKLKTSERRQGKESIMSHQHERDIADMSQLCEMMIHTAKMLKNRIRLLHSSMLGTSISTTSHVPPPSSLIQTLPASSFSVHSSPPEPIAGEGIESISDRTDTDGDEDPNPTIGYQTAAGE